MSVVVPVAPLTAGAGEAVAVDAWTSISEELSVALLVAGAGSAGFAAVLGAVAGCSTSEGLESGAGAGELSCA